MMHGMRRFLFIAVAFLFLAPAFAQAQTASYEVSGWIPYWREEKGVAEALANLDKLNEINPFGYVVQDDGLIVDMMGIADEPWKTLIAEAKKRKVRVIPTVMWCNPDAMHKILSVQKTRIALEDEITALVKREGFDGIDIDFECKRAEDKNYFSTFLKGLYQRMGNKWVMCTIESRTPLADRYLGTPPADATQYANDFVQINKYCDRVRFMTYDQQTIDQRLGANAEAQGKVYAPVADVAWVEKAIKLAAQTIPKRKIVLGIATYGYEWEVTAYADGFTYDLLWSFNPGYATPIAQTLGITPARSIAGEMAFSYVPTSTPPLNGTQWTQVPNSGANGESMAAAVLQAAKANNSSATFRYMTWSDATAIKQKVDLAKRLGVRGIALFKIDGGADPALWSIVK